MADPEAGVAVAERAGGVGAGGLALAEQVVAVLGDGRGLAAGLSEPAAGLAAAPGGHALTHGFSVFGYHVTGSTGALFLYGIVVGAAAMLGLGLLLAGARRTSRRGHAARRELKQSRGPTAVSQDREPIGQRENAQAETARSETARADETTRSKTARADETARANTARADETTRVRQNSLPDGHHDPGQGG